MPVSLKTRPAQITPRLDNIQDQAVVRALNDMAKVISDGLRNAYDDFNLVGQTKILTFTRDLATASGDQTLSGFGFTPRSMTVLAAIDGAKASCNGMSDKTRNYCLYSAAVTAADQMGIDTAAFIHLLQAAGAFQTAVVKAFNNDGAVLTWTKTGAPAGTATLLVMGLA